MKNKQIMMIVIIAVLAGGLGFFGGLKYGQSQKSSLGRNFQNLTPEQRQQMGQGFRGDGTQAGRDNRAGGPSGGFATGEILSQDDKSVTIKLRDGGSKIIFFSDSTSISKMADGAKTDLGVGKEVVVTGSANSDGSITAQSIQIRPAAPAPAPAPPTGQNPK